MKGKTAGCRRDGRTYPSRPSYAFAALLSCLLLAACGGGGGGSDGNDRFSVGGTVSGLNGTLVLTNQSGNSSDRITLTGNGSFTFSTRLDDGQPYDVAVASQPGNQECSVDNGSGTISGANITSVRITCSSLASLSGTISAAVAIGFDSDVNDPNAPYTDNSSGANAQAIDNNVFTLHGFASAEGLSNYGLTGRFADTADEDDYYRVTLQANQTVQLQVVDYDGLDLEATYSGDLDLYLYQFNSLTGDYDLVDSSQSTTEFEEVTPPADGDYLIQVHAFSPALTLNPGASKYVLRLSLGQLSSTTTRLPLQTFVPGEMIVKFSDPRIDIDAMTAHTAVAGTALTLNHQDLHRPVHAKIALQQAPGQPGSVSRQQADSKHYDEKFLTLRAIKRMAQREDVDYAEPNYIMRPLTAPNDNLYSYQWHYPLLNLPQAWDITTGTPAGDPVIVAVVDSGIFLDHPDMQGQLVAGYDFISDPDRARDGDGIDNNPDDPGDDPERGKSSWHGTHVAGTIAAQTNDSYGVAGTSWGARIIPVRVLGKEGGTTADVLEGIRYAAGLSNVSGTVPADPADIINLSLGGGGFAQAVQDTVTAVRNTGTIIIAAAGNENSSLPSYPAAYEGVVSVSAVTYDKSKAEYSNFGTTIDVAAPGGDITQDLNGDGRPDGVLSAVADDTSGSRAPIWAFAQGTSMAAPHVAGVAALMKAVHPGLTPDDFDNLLQSGNITEDLGDTGRDNTFGYGLIDANLAVREAQRLAGGGTAPSPPPQLAASPSSLVLGAGTSATVTLSNVGGSPDPTDIEFDGGTIPPWLAVTADSTDANGLGTYRLTVDRSGLGNGTYRANLVIHYQRSGMADSVTLPVTMRVGSFTTEGQLNVQYVVLVDADNPDETLDTVIATDQNGSLSYVFDNVAPGDYIIFSGTDVDNDQIICQSGESCGAYPSLVESQAITVQGDAITNLDIPVDILGGFSASASTAPSPLQLNPRDGGLRRTVVKTPDNTANKTLGTTP